MTADTHLRCRWCEWETPKFWTNQSGQKRSGWSRLQAHIEEHHEEQAMALAKESCTEYIDLSGREW